MLPSLMTFRFIEDHIHENGGTGSSKLDKITSLYFYRGVDCHLRPILKISGSWVGSFDVFEPDDFLLHVRTYT